MDLQLTGKRALVTGSSIGIGEAIARTLAAEGAIVAVHGRDRARADRVADAIAATDSQAVVLLGDLTDDAAVAHLVDEAERQLGGVTGRIGIEFVVQQTGCGASARDCPR